MMVASEKNRRCADLVRTMRASVTSPLAAKCSRKRSSVRYLGRFLTHILVLHTKKGTDGKVVKNAVDLEWKG